MYNKGQKEIGFDKLSLEVHFSHEQKKTNNR